MIFVMNDCPCTCGFCAKQKIKIAENNANALIPHVLTSLIGAYRYSPIINTETTGTMTFIADELILKFCTIKAVKQPIAIPSKLEK